MILPDVASTRAAIPMILITLLREEKDPKHVPGEGKVSPLQKRTTRRFADKPIIQGAESPIAAASTALLCLSGLRRAALHLPCLQASRCSKRVIESAPGSLPLSHTLLRHFAIPDIHAFYSCKRFRFCSAHHLKGHGRDDKRWEGSQSCTSGQSDTLCPCPMTHDAIS